MFSDHPAKECCWRRLLAVVPLAAKLEVRELKGFSSARHGLGEPCRAPGSALGKGVSAQNTCRERRAPLSFDSVADRALRRDARPIAAGGRHSVGTD